MDSSREVPASKGSDCFQANVRQLEELLVSTVESSLKIQRAILRGDETAAELTSWASCKRFVDEEGPRILRELPIQSLNDFEAIDAEAFRCAMNRIECSYAPLLEKATEEASAGTRVFFALHVLRKATDIRIVRRK